MSKTASRAFIRLMFLAVPLCAAACSDLAGPSPMPTGYKFLNNQYKIAPGPAPVMQYPGQNGTASLQARPAITAAAPMPAMETMPADMQAMPGTPPQMEPPQGEMKLLRPNYDVSVPAVQPSSGTEKAAMLPAPRQQRLTSLAPSAPPRGAVMTPSPDEPTAVETNGSVTTYIYDRRQTGSGTTAYELENGGGRTVPMAAPEDAESVQQ